MKVLLIAANTERVNMIALPLGLGLVAAAGRRAGHDVRLLDLLREPDPRAAAAREAAAFAPGVIGISVRNIDDQCRENPRFLLAPVREVVAACRSVSAAPVVLGGPGFSIFPRAALEYLGADFGIAGDGEEAFVALLAALEAGAAPTGIDGLFARGGGAPAVARAEARDLDALPAWDDALAVPEEPDAWVPVQSRRGCPNDCSYCSTSLVQGRRLRSRSPGGTVECIARLAARGARRFYFVDNSFNVPEQHALDLCGLLDGVAPRVAWRCILYPERVGERLVSAMARAGCVEVSLGFESGSPAVLRVMNKRFTPEDVRRASDLLRAHGIRRFGFLLLGGPGETRATVEESLAFARSLALDELRITVGVRIYPGTALARQATAEGVIAADDDLLEPKFYLAPGLEGWIEERVAAGQAPRPTPGAPA